MKTAGNVGAPRRGIPHRLATGRNGRNGSNSAHVHSQVNDTAGNSELPAISCSTESAVGRPARPILGPSRRDIRSSRAIAYTSALLAVVIGIVHAALAPVIVVAGVKPNLILVAVVLVAATFGLNHGILWAFIGGTVANLLVPAPLGSIPIVLLVVAALVAGGARLIGRFSYSYPIAAALAASLVADALALAILALVAEPPQGGLPFQLLLPAAVLNAAIAGLFVVPVRALAVRVLPDEAATW